MTDIIATCQTSLVVDDGIRGMTSALEAAAAVRFGNPPRHAAMNAPMSCITPVAQAIVDTMQAPRFGHAVAVELADANLQVDSGSHRSTACPAPYASARSAPEPEQAP
jgi:hypothetical protein